MPQQFNRVRAGDLITDIFVNNLLAYLESLELRVQALEQGSGSVAITSLPFGDIRVGQEVHIRGRNFGFSKGQQKVFIDDVAVNEFKLGSDDTELIFTIPSMPDIAEAGKIVVLTVQNAISTDSRTLLLLPALLGSATVSYKGVDDPAPPQPIQAGKPARFKFTLNSSTTTTPFLITPKISIDAWQDLLQVLDSQKNVVPSRQLTVATNQEVTFYILIKSIPANTPVNTAFNLTVGVTAGSVTGGATASATVGQAAEATDPAIKTVSFDNATFSSNAPGVGDFNNTTNTIRVKEGITATANLTATFAAAGTYNLLPADTLTVQNWTLQVSPDTLNPIRVGTAEVANGSTSQKSIALLFKAGQGAGDNVEMNFRIEHQGVPAPNSYTVTFTLIRLP